MPSDVALLEDAAAERELSERGYVVRPFLADAALYALKKQLPVPSPLPSDFWATTLSSDVEYRRRVFHLIKAITREAFERLLPDYQLCLAAIVAKRGRAMHGTVPLHQDWWLTNNSVHRALHFWCPLNDVDEVTGCLRVVPGSHRIVSPPCPLFPTDYDTGFQSVLDLLESELAVPVPTPAGAAVIYDERLLHGSGPNRSSHSRIAINCALIPAAVSPHVYHVDPDDPTRMNVLKVDQDFLCRFSYGGRVVRPYPTGVTQLDSIAAEAHSLAPHQLAELRRLRAAYPL